jgi:hypothetical protein
MSVGLAPLPRKTSTARLRCASAQALERSAQAVPVLDFTARPADLGRRAKNFEEHTDHDLGLQYKRAAYELDGVLVFLQFFRHTYDGNMTLYVDLAACVASSSSPLSLAARALEALNLQGASRTFVHTKAEELFWQRVDPLVVAAKLSKGS